MGRPSKYSYEEKMHRRRHYDGLLFETLVTSKIHLKRYPMKRQAALKGRIRSSRADFNFLQYDYLIRSFVLRKYNLTEEELAILLYAYPILIFTNDQFIDMCKELRIKHRGHRKNLMTKGYFTKYSTDKWKVYYTFTKKATNLMDKMHKMYLLEEEIPMAWSNNPVVRSSKPEDNTLEDLFNKFNQKVRDNVGG